jgi:hypothetical protein
VQQTQLGSQGLALAQANAAAASPVRAGASTQARGDERIARLACGNLYGWHAGLLSWDVTRNTAKAKRPGCCCIPGRLQDDHAHTARRHAGGPAQPAVPIRPARAIQAVAPLRTAMAVTRAQASKTDMGRE